MNRRSFWLVACAVACVVALLYGFSGYPLLDPDEGRNAEVAREMAASGNFVLPQLNGVPYLDKPVLYFAVGAIAMKLLGPTELAARLPSLLFTLATIVAVAWFGWHLFGVTGAWTAGVATAATPFTVAYARTVIFDSTLSFFVVVALIAFYMAVERAEENANANSTARGGAAGAWWTTLAWAAMALGVLTKGPIAIALPLMVVGPFVIWRRVWRALADTVSVLLFVAIILPWLLAVSNEVPDFLHYALVTETARRLATDELQRTGPFWYFAAILPAAALPWTLVLAGSWRPLKALRDRYGNLDGRVTYLLLWILVPALFFTLSQSKRPQYVLPLVPAIALLVAAAWSAKTKRLSGARLASVGLVLLGLFLIASSGAIAGWVSARPEVAATIPKTAIVLGSSCIIGGMLTWLGKQGREMALVGLSIPIAAIPVSSGSLMDAIGRERSAMQIAHTVQQVGGDELLVVSIETFPLSLPFYLQNTVVLATEDGSELTSNYFIRNFDRLAGRSSTIRPTEWWREILLSCPRPTVFVISSGDTDRRSILDSTLTLLVDTGKYAAYGPCGATNLARSTE